MHLATINTRSISNKINQFQHNLLENSIDLCAVTETWLKEDDEYGLHEIPPPGFKIISKPRCDGRQGGGIALIYKENYTINDHKINTNSQYMELSAFDLHTQDHVIDVLVIYRYPNTSVVSFCDDLADILGNNILTLKGHCILTSDFNIHTDDVLDNDTRTFNDMLDSLGMINHITFPMHKQGHTLELFIKEENSPLIMKVTRGHLISDHHFIHAHLNICKNKPKVNDVTYRKYKQKDKIAFKEDLQRTLEVEHATHDFRSLVTRYNSDLMQVLDRHAPEKRRLVKVTHKQPWFTDKIQREIILRRAKEQKWLQDQSYYSFMAFYYQRRHVANIIQQDKREYYSTMLQENRYNVKAVFTIANKLLFRKEPLPQTEASK